MLPTGGGPDPIQLFLDLFKTFKAASTKDITSVSWGHGNILFPMTIMRIGRIFEDAVIRSMGVSKNTKIYKPYITSTRGVIPDNVMSGSYKEYQMPTDPAYGSSSIIKRKITFPNATFQEVKMKSEVTLSDPNNPGQITAMLQTLSKMKGGYDNGKWNPALKASDYGAATLVFITPANAVIGNDILELAKELKVNIYQRKVEVDTEDKERIRVGPGAQVLQNSGAGVPGALPPVVPLIAAPGASKKLDFNKL